MARRPRTRLPFELEEEITKLRRELWTARVAVIQMAPPDAQRLFGGMYGCESREAAYKWLHDAVEKAIALAKPAGEMGDHGGIERAYCPLCRGSSSSPYARGFSYPEGLKRHLDGSYNARHCDVMKIALAIAIDSAEDDGLRLGPVS